ncbi:hypothetical protein ACFRMN_34315 [Streptomyces sp. NPDC056835]|uniref:hypothetical protein n=1 Tax=Streptomyces sp. NPDC056835 TaxID=3345956 RepID=UPI003689F311
MCAPFAAAAAVGTVAFALWGTQGDASDNASRPMADTRPNTAAAGVPQASVGDKDNPATWRLPVEAYIPARTEARMVSGVRDDLIDECMGKAGYEKWEPAPDLPDLSGESLTDRRYGIHDAELTAIRGYHPDAALQEAYDAALEVGAVDTSGSDPEALRGCVQAADGEAPDTQTDELVQQIDGDSYTESMKDPAVVAAFANWSSCMNDKGYAYKTPLEPLEDPRFSHPTDVIESEITTAKADLDCRTRFDVTRTWFDAEAKIQQAQVQKNLTALNEVKAENRSVVAQSAAIAGAR